MKIVADISIVPLGVGLSLSPYIAECEKIFVKHGLKTKLHAFGTNVEGEWEKVFISLRECHERLHELGVPRLHTVVKIGTRIDRSQGIEDKVKSVEEKVWG